MQKLKVAFRPYYPMWNHYDKKCVKFPSLHVRCDLAGLAIDIINYIAEDAKLEIEAYNWTGVSHADFLKSIENGTIDMMGDTYAQTAQRMKSYEFSETLYYSITRLAVRRQHRAMEAFFDFFNVFDLTSWTLFAISFLLFTTIGLAVRFVEWRLVLRSQLNIMELIWRMVRLQFIQYDHIGHKLISGNFSVLTFSFLQCAVLLGLYQCWVITSAIKTKNPYPFRTEDLPHVLSENRYSFVMANYSAWYFELIETSFASPFYELREAMINNKVEVVENYTMSFKAVEKKKMVVVLQDDDYSSYLADTTFCNFVYLESPFPPMEKRIMMRKGHPLMAKINQSIINQRILIQRAYRKYIKYRDYSFCDHSPPPFKPLKLTPYLGVVLLYCIGVTFAVLAFGSEYYFERK
ncbi:hypothetical protein M3Y95_00384800 [Aphelenchoides besseyi]|nr:hypothetical protein M3Y95_00384800 [Aphelenchoides besseyi]